MNGDLQIHNEGYIIMNSLSICCHGIEMDQEISVYWKSTGMILLTVCKSVNITFNSRAIAGVRGFCRETLIALAANIESRKWRR